MLNQNLSLFFLKKCHVSMFKKIACLSRLLHVLEITKLSLWKEFPFKQRDQRCFFCILSL